MWYFTLRAHCRLDLDAFPVFSEHIWRSGGCDAGPLWIVWSFKQCPIRGGQGIVLKTDLFFVCLLLCPHIMVTHFYFSWLKQLTFLANFALSTVGWDPLRTGNKRSLNIIYGDSRGEQLILGSVGPPRGCVLSRTAFFGQGRQCCRLIIFPCFPYWWDGIPPAFMFNLKSLPLGKVLGSGSRSIFSIILVQA